MILCIYTLCKKCVLLYNFIDKYSHVVRLVHVAALLLDVLHEDLRLAARWRLYARRAGNSRRIGNLTRLPETPETGNLEADGGERVSAHGRPLAGCLHHAQRRPAEVPPDLMKHERVQRPHANQGNSQKSCV